MLGADFVVLAYDSALEQREHRFDRVRVCSQADPGKRAGIDHGLVSDYVSFRRLPF